MLYHQNISRQEGSRGKSEIRGIRTAIARQGVVYVIIAAYWSDYYGGACFALVGHVGGAFACSVATISPRVLMTSWSRRRNLHNSAHGGGSRRISSHNLHIRTRARLENRNVGHSRAGHGREHNGLNSAA